MKDSNQSRRQLLDEVNRLRQQVAELEAKALEHQQADGQRPGSEPTNFSILAEMTTAAIFIYQGTRNCYVNPAAETITGYSMPELLAMDFWDMVHPDFRGLVKERGLARQEGEPVQAHYEVKIITKTGQERWLDYSGSLIQLEGKPAVLGTAFDITERKQAEAENARLYEQAQRDLATRREAEIAIAQRNAELLTLQYAAATLATSLDLQFVLDTFTREITDLLGAEGCVILEWERAGDALNVMAVYGLPEWTNDHSEKSFPLSQIPLAQQVLSERRAQQLSSGTGRTLAELTYLGAITSKGLLLLPMEFQDQVVGLIQIIAGRPEPGYSSEAVALAQMLANQAASAVQNAQLYAEVTRRLKEQISLQAATTAFSSTLDLDTVLSQIAEQMGRAVDASSAYICSYDAERMTSTVLAEYFSPRASAKEKVSDLGVSYPLPRDFSLDLERLLKGQPEATYAGEADKQQARWGHMQTFEAETILNIPLQLRGQVIAFAELWESRDRRQFTPDEIVLCQGIAQQAAIALEHARLYAQAQQEIGERIRVEGQLRQSETRQRALLNAIPDVMFRVTRAGQVLDYHRGSAHDSFWPANIERGQNLSKILPPEPTRLTLERIGKALEEGSQQIFEFRWGEPKNYQDYETRLVSSGEAEILGIVRNITERKRMEEQAIQAERLAILGRLSAALTHEINNPLQSMQAHLDLMLEFSASLNPGEDKKFLHIMRQEVVRLNDITQRILNLARPWPVLRRPVLIADLLRDVLMLADRQLKQRHIQLITDWQVVDPILATPDQLTQVFLNVLINAIEATPAHGQLQVKLYVELQDVVIAFINSGAAIPEDILPHIFDPFFTTKAEGSGLGLWVTQNLVRQHGGTIVAKNLEGNQGVAFTVTLPRMSLTEVTDDSAYQYAN